MIEINVNDNTGVGLRQYPATFGILQKPSQLLTFRAQLTINEEKFEKEMFFDWYDVFIWLTADTLEKMFWK